MLQGISSNGAVSLGGNPWVPFVKKPSPWVRYCATQPSDGSGTAPPNTAMAISSIAEGTVVGCTCSETVESMELQPGEVQRLMFLLCFMQLLSHNVPLCLSLGLKPLQVPLPSIRLSCSQMFSQRFAKKDLRCICLFSKISVDHKATNQPSL